MIPVAALSLGRLLLRRETIVVVAAIGLFVMWKAKEAALIREGEAREARRQFAAQVAVIRKRDSTIIAGLDQAIRRANDRFFAVDAELGVSLDSNATLAEKLKRRPTDTVLVKEYVAQTEQLREDCEACRETARAAIDTAAAARVQRDGALARLRAFTDSAVNAPRTPTSKTEKAGWALSGVAADELFRALLKRLRR